MALLVAYLGCGNSSPKATARPAKLDSIITGAICETVPVQVQAPAAAAESTTRSPAEGATKKKATKEPPAESKSVRETMPARQTAEKPVPSTSEQAVATVTRTKSLPRMWDFGSENCIPCKTMLGILNPMMKEFAGKVDVRIINVYQEQALASQYRIQIIPTQIFMDTTGKELFRHVGVFTRDSIVSKFKQFGFAN